MSECMLQMAFKEWAVICESLAQGRQAIILRKGGIHEASDEFAVEHTRFWLYPTYTHQQNLGIQDTIAPLLTDVEAQRPPAGKVPLQLWAEVTGIYRIRELLPALLLSHLHGWSDDSIRKRFNYKMPGLHLLVVRIYRIPHPHEIQELPSYQGCRSWVTLEERLPMNDSVPVLNDEDFRIVQNQVDHLLSPTAFA